MPSFMGINGITDKDELICIRSLRKYGSEAFNRARKALAEEEVAGRKFSSNREKCRELVRTAIAIKQGATNCQVLAIPIETEPLESADLPPMRFQLPAALIILKELK